MADFSNIALSGLQASQQALNVVASNTSNANTPSYSRRIISFNTQNFSASGDGVTLASVQRVYDQFAAKDLRQTTSAYNASNLYIQMGLPLQSYMTDSTTSVGANLQDMFTTIQGVNSDPSSTTARQTMFNSLQNVANQFNAANTQLQQQNSSINQQLTSFTVDINSITSNIATLNDKIVSQSANPNFQNNDLLDARDAQLQNLSKYLSFNTISQSNGALNVVLSNGQALVQGPQNFNLTTAPLPAMPTQNTIVLQQSTVNVDISNYLGGGQLNGLLSYRQQILDPTYNKLGLLAIGLADKFNQQNVQGIDLNNTVGGNIFNSINSAAASQGRVVANTSNVGAATLTATIQNSALLTTSNYSLSYNGVNYTLIRLSDNTTTVLAPPGAYPGALATTDGFSINVSAAPAANDSFLITPTRNGSYDIGLNITSGNQVAIASSVQSKTSVNNLGTGVITTPAITNNANVNFLTPLRITFKNPAVPGAVVYDIYNADTNALISANVAYVSGNNVVGAAPATINYGYDVNITGAPVAGDNFFISTGAGNNVNGTALAAIQTTAVFSNNNTLQQQSDQVTGDMSASIHAQQLSSDASNSLMGLAQSRVNAVSGVNLDEEAAHLVQYQQAYQANAKVFQVTSTLFDSLLHIFG